MCVESTNLLATLIDIMTYAANKPGNSMVYRACNRIAAEQLNTHEYKQWQACPAVLDWHRRINPIEER